MNIFFIVLALLAIGLILYDFFMIGLIPIKLGIEKKFEGYKEGENIVLKSNSIAINMPGGDGKVRGPYYEIVLTDMRLLLRPGYLTIWKAMDLSCIKSVSVSDFFISKRFKVIYFDVESARETNFTMNMGKKKGDQWESAFKKIAHIEVSVSSLGLVEKQ